MEWDEGNINPSAGTGGVRELKGSWAAVESVLEATILTVCLQIFPSHRNGAHRVGPGVEMREDPIERRRRNGEELDAYASLE